MSLRISSIAENAAGNPSFSAMSSKFLLDFCSLMSLVIALFASAAFGPFIPPDATSWSMVANANALEPSAPAESPCLAKVDASIANSSLAIVMVSFDSLMTFVAKSDCSLPPIVVMRLVTS